MTERLSDQTQPASTPAVAAKVTRRRLLTGGAVAGPVLALRSGNVLATTEPWRCRSVSAYLSGAGHLSNHPPGENSCDGRSPGYWNNDKKPWPIDRATKMQQVWIAVGATNNYFDKTLVEVLAWTGNLDQYQQGAHLIAAWLNFKSGFVSADILPGAMIKKMGNAVLTGQPFYPAAPAMLPVWNGEDVVAYLQSTFHTLSY